MYLIFNIFNILCVYTHTYKYIYTFILHLYYITVYIYTHLDLPQDGRNFILTSNMCNKVKSVDMHRIQSIFKFAMRT